MDPNKLVIDSIASDLKRIALGLHRGSDTMVSRFASEVLKRRSQVDTSSTPAYINKLISRLDQALHDSDTALMYSTLLQNFSLRHYSSASS